MCEEAQTSRERKGGTGHLALQKAGAVVLEQDMGVCRLQGENPSYKRGAEGAELEKRIHMVTNTPFLSGAQILECSFRGTAQLILLAFWG